MAEGEDARQKAAGGRMAEPKRQNDAPELAKRS